MALGMGVAGSPFIIPHSGTYCRKMVSLKPDGATWWLLVRDRDLDSNNNQQIRKNSKMEPVWWYTPAFPTLGDRDCYKLEARLPGLHRVLAI